MSVSKRYLFRRRIESIFKDFEVFSYMESRTGPDRRVVPGLDEKSYRPWVELDLRPRKRKFPKQSCYVAFEDLAKLAKLLGTEDIKVTGFDLGYDCRVHGESETDNVGYIVARGVKFK